MFKRLILFALSSLLLPSLSAAQENRSDVAVSFTGGFNRDSSGSGLLQTPTNSGGFLASYRLGFASHSAVELNYGYSRNSQYYTDSLLGPLAGQQAAVHEATAAYVFSLGHSTRLDPFVLGGSGALVFSPNSNSFNSIVGAGTQPKPAFLYGGGLDYRLRGGLGLRVQYRGLVYKAPDFGLSELSTGSWTHTAEPSAGLVFRF
jgi:outer membrane immunogenic protein